MNKNTNQRITEQYYANRYDSSQIKIIQEKYKYYCEKAYEETVHKEYCELQMTWNYQVLTETIPFIGNARDQRAMSLGSFLSLVEMSLADRFSEVICVDQKNYIPSFAPENVKYYESDLDSSNWNLPDGNFEICYMVEILEHLLWSPVSLLKQLSNQAKYLIITTPDDREWPKLKNRPYTRHQHFMSIPSAFPGSVGNPEPMVHCKQYSQSEFIELLSFTGFRLVNFSRIGIGGHQMLAICESINFGV